MQASPLWWPIGRVLVYYMCLIGFLIATDPQRLPSVVLVVPFGLLLGAFYATLMLVFGLLRDENNLVLGARLRRPRVLAGFVAAFPVMSLVLQSIGQLSLWDVVIVVGLFGLAYIYVARSKVSF